MRAWLALACLALATVAVATEARLEVPENMPVGMTVPVRLVVTNGAQIASYVLPDVPGLTLEQSGTVRQYRNDNGRTEESISVMLRADAAGDYRVPAMTVHLADRTTTRTEPVSVRAGPGNPKLVGNAYAETDFSPDTIVPGEPTTMRFRLYLRRDMAANEVEVKPPEGAVLLGGEHGSVSRSSAYDLRGEEWQLFTVTWQLTADQPGTLEASGQQTVQPRHALGQGQTRQVPVRAGKLSVLALPSEGRPADFAGLVGPIALSAALDRERISTGEGTTLRVTISGPLAVRAKVPQPQLPHGLRAYPKETEDGDDRRVFAWDLVPEGSGTFAIPAISLPYFDPTAREYRRAEAPSLSLTVVPGRVRELAVAGAPAPAPAETPAAPIVGREPPAPLRGSVMAEPSPNVAPFALIGGALIGLLAALAPRGLRALRRPTHRGRALAAAVAAGNLDAAAAVLERLRPALADTGQREAATRLRDALDTARFGGAALPDSARELVSRLEGVP